MPRRTSDEHLHEYDDNWQCKCGFRLIMDSEEKTGKMRVKAFITPDGKTIGVGDKSHEKKPQPKATRRTR